MAVFFWIELRVKRRDAATRNQQNVLGLNMVHEIATGKRTWEDARTISEESTVAYNLGRSAPYGERLLFEVPQEGTEDLDKGGISDAVLRQAAGKVKDLVSGSQEEAPDR